MSDLIDEAPEGTNAPEFSVSELSGAIKRMIEGEFAHVRIKGEVGRVSLPRSGHIYLDLKDDRAVISGVIWKGVAQRLSVQPEEGMEVVATGRLTTFPGQSKYQVVIDDIKPAGMGALMAMLEKRKAALAAEAIEVGSPTAPAPAPGPFTPPPGGKSPSWAQAVSPTRAATAIIDVTRMSVSFCCPEAGVRPRRFCVLGPILPARGDLGNRPAASRQERRPRGV